MHLLILALSSMLLFSGNLFSKVRVLTFHYNQASFIELQHRCLQKFMTDDYEFIVFNDAPTVDNEQAIQETCDRLGIQCVRYQQEWHSSIYKGASWRHAQVIQYALDHYGYDHDDAVVIMDGDAFFIRGFSIENQLKDFDIFGMGRGDDHPGPPVNYFWPPFVVFDPTKLPNIRDLKFDLACIEGYWHDTGAESHHYLKNNPSVKYRRVLPEVTVTFTHVPKEQLLEMGFHQEEIDLIQDCHEHACQIEFHYDRSVLHFREVSFETTSHDQKLECLYTFINRILANL